MSNLPEPNIFKAYDIRGIVNVTLTTETVEQIGRSLGSFSLQQNVKPVLQSNSVRDIEVKWYR